MGELLFAAKQWAHGFLAEWGIMGVSLLSFTESFIQPIPAAIIVSIGAALSMPVTTTVFIALISNIAGAIVGYFLGLYLGKPVCSKIFKAKHLQKAEEMFAKYGVWAVIVCGITPLPFKVAVVSAGAFEMPFIKFVIGAIVSRTIHFGILWVILYWGLEWLRFMI